MPGTGPIIVGLHGLANKPPPKTLAKWWRAAIVEGLRKNRGVDDPNVPFRMVYWADRLYAYPQHRRSAYTFDRLYNREPYREAAAGALKRYDEGFMDSVRHTLSTALGAGLDAIYKVAGFEVAGEFLLKRTGMLRDLSFYYDPERRLRGLDGEMGVARKVLMDVLRAGLEDLGGRRVMIIAHSMGTIIAYDVLRDIGQDKKHGEAKWQDFTCARLTTIGSPLGLALVKDKVYAERTYDAESQRLRTPTIVTEDWYNFADKRDPVSFDLMLRDDYQANARYVRVRDDLVHNDYTSPAGRANPHKSYGYLRTPEVSDAIADFLGL